MKIGRKTESK